eukprot:TRINITY_DN6190_c2_g1_i1.p1 TRINITY_DN6190_c2_g1~~TRINITY_DN6190_c2_g1_i1.p1  ORF type:complete len:233 (-),score=81.89 TRINITY_DN6190_c2_g1_i1:126-824(-)
MEEARAKDEFDLQNKRPALEKLKLLPKVERAFQNYDFRNTFLSQNGLNEVANWLQPYSANNKQILPHVTIRKAILQALYSIKEDITYALEGSNIGKQVMFLYKHPKETMENKKIAQKLIDKWLRPIFQLSDQYSDLVHDVEHIEPTYNRKIKRRPKKNNSGKTLFDQNQGIDYEDSLSRFSYLPRKADMDYTRTAPVEVEAYEPVRNEQREIIFKQMQNLKKRKTKKRSALI